MKRKLITTQQHRFGDKWVFINTYSQAIESKYSKVIKTIGYIKVIKTIGYINVNKDKELHNQIGFFEDMAFTEAYEHYLSLYCVLPEDEYSLESVKNFINLYDYFKNMKNEY